MNENKKTILLVEDEVIIAMAEARTLEKHGYAVITVSSGEEAVETAARERAIDLILMDIDLGSGMDGTEAAEIILKGRDVPVVFLSSHTEPEVVEKTEKITSYGYVVKNSGDTVLMASIRMAFKLFDANTRINGQREELEQANEELNATVEEMEAANEELIRSREEIYEREREQSQLLKSMINAFVLFESVLDEAGNFISYRFVYINDAYERITGVRNDEVRGKTVHEVWPGTEEGWVEAYGNVAMTGVPQTFEMYHEPTGKLYHCNVYRPWNSNERFCVIFEDITERNRFEEELIESRDLLDATQKIAGVGGWEWDVESGTLSWTAETFRIHGLDAEEMLKGPSEYVGRSISCYAPEARPVIEELFRRSIEKGEPYSLECAFTSFDRRRKWIQTTGRPVIKDGKVVRVVGNIIDITKRRKAETALRESEEYLKKAQSVAHLGSWIWDIKNDRLYWSDEMYRIFGIDKEEFTGNLAEVIAKSIHPDDRAKVEESNRSVMDKNTPIPVDYRIIRPDGSERWVWAEAGELETDESGKSSVLRGIVLDITERKKAEKAMLESEARFRTLFENVPVMIDGFDGNGKCVLWNEQCRKIFGWTIEEVNAREDPLFLFYPDPEVREHVKRTVTDSPVGEFNEFHPVTKDGKELAVLWANFLIEGGEVINIGYDITERKRVEEELRFRDAAVTAAANGIVITDRNGVIQWANPAFEEMTGYPADEALGKNPRDLVKSGAQEGEYYRVLWETILSGDVWRGEIINRRKDGNLYTEEMTITPVKDTRGNITGFIAVKQDVSGRRIIEERMGILSQMVDNAPSSITVHDGNGNFLYANKKTFEHHGCSESEFMAMNLRDIDIPESAALFAERVRLIEEKGEASFEVGHRRKDGTVFPLEVFVKKVNWGEIPALLSIGTDITERKKAEKRIRESEQKYRELFNSMAQGAFSQERSGRLLDVNSAALEIFGMSREEFLSSNSGDSRWKVFDENGRAVPGEQHPSMEALASGKPVINRVLQVYNEAEAGFRWLSTNAIPRFRAGEPEPCEVFVTMHDITAIKESEREKALGEARLRTLLELSRMGESTEKEISDYVLEEIVSITESSIGFIGFIDEGETEMVVHAWSKEAMEQCAMDEKPLHFNLATSGIWADAVKRREVVMVNDYSVENPGKKGIPAGHVSLRRLISVPLMDGDSVVAVAAVGNKEGEYDDSDILHVALLLDGMWKLKNKKEMEDAERESGRLLAASEEKFRTVADFTYDWEYWKDPDGRFVYISPSCERITGCAPGEFMEDPSLMTRIIHPGDREYMIAHFHETEKGHLVNEQGIDFRIVRNDGEVVWLANRSQPVYGDGMRFLGIRGSNRDITVRKKVEHSLRESEEEFRALLNATNESAFLMDPDGRVLALNEIAARRLGRKVDELEGACIYDFIPSEVADYRKVKVLEVVETGEALRFEDERQGIVFEHSIFPIFNEDGKTTRIAVFGMDITERKKAEEALIRFADEKQALLRELQHRIKNTLAMITSLANLEADNAEDPAVHEALNNIRARIESLSRLYVILYTSGETREVRLDDYIRSIGQSVMDAYASDEARIVLDVRADAVSIDTKSASSLGLVVNELLMNAFKYAFSDRNGGTVRVELREKDDFLELVVADDGAGLPDGFDLERSGGFGLRLARMLAEQMKGGFEYESANGTTFRVRVKK